MIPFPCSAALRRIAIFALVVLAATARAADPGPTPLRLAGFTRLSTSAEISAWLALAAKAMPGAHVDRIGTSVQGRPIEALVIEPAGGAAGEPFTVMMVGSQHGTESAGAESLMVIARAIAIRGPPPPLAGARLVLVVNANPDGRELRRRANANRVNLNTDYVALSQPESAAIIGALHAYMPDVALDIHESAILKRESLAREGLLTDFEAQFEYANNPNVAQPLRDLAAGKLLPAWIARVGAGGLPAQRYIGEIRSSRQPLTNGGLTLRNLRNRIGVEGVLSLLMETRLDPRDGSYPSYRNIRVRVGKQVACIEAFLALVGEHRDPIRAAVRAARARVPTEPLLLRARYGPDPHHPRERVALRRLGDGAAVPVDFDDHRYVIADRAIHLPAAYLVPGGDAALAAWLARQGVVHGPAQPGRAIRATQFVRRAGVVIAQRARVAPRAGDLWVGLDQPRARLAALLLEPQSDSAAIALPAEDPAALSQMLALYRVAR
ncbi:MAG: M14 family zinc carboxypeptidase [Gammaproteobacteria bacterium]